MNFTIPYPYTEALITDEDAGETVTVPLPDSEPMLWTMIAQIKIAEAGYHITMWSEGVDEITGTVRAKG